MAGDEALIAGCDQRAAVWIAGQAPAKPFHIELGAAFGREMRVVEEACRAKSLTRDRRELLKILFTSEPQSVYPDRMPQNWTLELGSDPAHAKALLLGGYDKLVVVRRCQQVYALQALVPRLRDRGCNVYGRNIVNGPPHPKAEE